ncbi:hypothetical protein VTI28DRAFT_208 [Corynascus sepedonium]
MHFAPTIFSSLALVLCADGAPVGEGDNGMLATFQAWITDCGDTNGHTTGHHLLPPRYTDICLPLPDDIRGLDVLEITDGCRITAFQSPVCDDYPYEGAYIDHVGCLWAGNREFRSYRLTCEEQETK